VDEKSFYSYATAEEKAELGAEMQSTPCVHSEAHGGISNLGELDPIRGGNFRPFFSTVLTVLRLHPVSIA
jgi:hypothetical protein